MMKECASGYIKETTLASNISTGVVVFYWNEGKMKGERLKLCEKSRKPLKRAIIVKDQVKLARSEREPGKS